MKADVTGFIDVRQQGAISFAIHSHVYVLQLHCISLQTEYTDFVNTTLESNHMANTFYGKFLHSLYVF